ncbi:FAD-dependent oxidoreductase [Thauera linaloolentis]|uniref:3-ketosteroid dehydrogenase n=1 Tax=Thauera linaloolentis (strain DSM 12138 / JCM 21573 / CCUG 41526 / CIP 105981 / IAM 15112 / NBRC 102519 / 47Lol) TaxID=1123367 RepID=N6XZM4_THAL4|nr:FAD-dependent oxidoreductase [Thauera linaloolentis]ENO87296.1 3-ketosteroid dehydrogenase [Thauera linaloolentis 47Lol = DSM 12138]MCM8566745.1 FAD-dependent oxidoreductase [Thauera linaloolentis]
MSKSHTPQMPSRRQALIRGGLAAGGLVSAGLAPIAHAAPKAAQSQHWDHEADVVCVGSGAAACSAAVTAASAGASVILVEKMPLPGGTTGKSGGVTWIPNNPLLRERGIQDDKADCLRYLARYAYPREYTPDSPTLGLPEHSYRLLEAFYDNGSAAVEHFDKLGAVRFRAFKMWFVDKYAPDYADHLPENKVSRGRALEPAEGASSSGGGASLASQMEKWLTERNMPILLEHRVTRVIKDGGRVIGIEAEHDGKLVRIRARRGVVFGTGGYAHNTDLIHLHQPAAYGACAMPGSTGDFIPIAQSAGARMGALGTGWRTQVVLEEALENRAIGLGAFVLPGDSMIVVNKYGRRLGNEKINYNDRTQLHFVFDPVKKEYPNHLQFMIFDGRSLDAFGGAFPIPADRRASRHLVEGRDPADLAARLSERLAKHAARTGGFTLAPDFAANLADTIGRFNGYAKAGKDPEFDRGLHEYDRDWQALFSPRREGTTQPENPMPNVTMHPLDTPGPLYAFILAPGLLDTNGGPMINANAQVLDADGQPIPGLYGAGNCIACPAHNAYVGAGGTIGLALTFGYIAGRHLMQAGGGAGA